MNNEVIITCAVTGAGDTAGRSDKVPVTPKQIAEAAIEAAKAGAAVAHCHVRNPKTGKGSRDVELYKEVVDRIRSSDTDVVINLTSGMGGDFEVQEDQPTKAGRRPTWWADRAPRPCGGAAAGDLHARLRHAQLRRREHDLHLDAEIPARRRQAGA
jgi:uncharacterized protein (DUF849 family)